MREKTFGFKGGMFCYCPHLFITQRQMVLTDRFILLLRPRPDVLVGS